MIKLLLTITILVNLSIASTNTIDKKISNNKKILTNSNYRKIEATLKIKSLANKIHNQNRNLIRLEKDIKKINLDIATHELLLEESKKKLEDLKDRSSNLIKEKKGNEEQIVDT
ncbi:MAG: peptidase M23, partial [Poseidonibacter sp.]